MESEGEGESLILVGVTVRLTFAIAMVLERSVCLMSARKESKNGEIEQCATSFMRLNRCHGDHKGGVWGFWWVGIYNT